MGLSNLQPSGPQAVYFQCPLAALTGIYATTLLVVLNSRIKFRVSSLSTTWKDTVSDRPNPVRNIMKGDNGSSVTAANRRELRVTVESHGDVLGDEEVMQFAMKQVRPWISS